MRARERAAAATHLDFDCIDVGTGSQQDLHDLDVAPHSCSHQHRAPRLRARVYWPLASTCALVIAPITGRARRCKGSVRTHHMSRIDVRPRLEQPPHGGRAAITDSIEKRDSALHGGGRVRRSRDDAMGRVGPQGRSTRRTGGVPPLLAAFRMCATRQCSGARASHGGDSASPPCPAIGRPPTSSPPRPQAHDHVTSPHGAKLHVPGRPPRPKPL